MNIPENDPNEPLENLSAARRRRQRRQLIDALTPDERANYLDEVARKAAPSFDFFLFSALAGAVIGVGYIVDSPYFLLLAALMAPLMAPIVGVSLGTILGSWRYFGRSIGGFAIGSLLVLLVGVLSGFAARVWLPMELLQVHIHAQLSWAAFIIIGLGAVLTTATLVKENHHPGIPSVAVAYGLYLPLGAAGFGLGSGIAHLWPDGLVLFVIHLAWVTLLGAVTLAVMGFRPPTVFGYSFGAAVLLVGVLLLFGFFGAGAVMTGQVALPTASYTPSATVPPSNTPEPPTDTPVPPSDTPTMTLSPTNSRTPTQTQTLTPTPVQAYVRVGGGFTGAVLRDGPDGVVVSSLFNGSVVEVTGESIVDETNRVWMKVIDLENDIEGWILQVLLITATPDRSLWTATAVIPTDTPSPVPTTTATATP